MSQVWAVCSGSYSDWMVHALYTNEAEAQFVVDEMNKAEYADYEVCDFSILDGKTDVKDLLTLWCNMNVKTGRIVEGEPRTDREGPWTNPPECSWAWNTYGLNGDTGTILVHGTNHEKVWNIYEIRKAEYKNSHELRLQRMAGNE